MNQHFLTYEQSLAVKELGFDEPCFGIIWRDNKITFNGISQELFTQMNVNIQAGFVPAPLKSQFFKWVREKYGINYPIRWFEQVEDEYPTYEQAEDACINKIIELLKLK